MEKKLYITHVNAKHEGNVFFPSFEKDFEIYETVNKSEIDVVYYRRRK